MRTIGVQELKTHTGRILREVIDRGEAIEATHRGNSIARITWDADQRERAAAVITAHSPDTREPRIL